MVLGAHNFHVAVKDECSDDNLLVWTWHHKGGKNFDKLGKMD